MELVICNNGKATTTSIKVAEYFGKQHKNVMQSIETLLKDQDVADRLNFQPIFSDDSYGRPQPAYELDRDGFTLLAMGFTGKTALTFKMKYIDAFNAAEKALLGATSLTPQMQIANAILLAGRMIEEQQVLLAQRDKMIAIAAPKAAIADRIECADGLYGFRQAAKILSLNENKFRTWLIQHDWIYYLGGRMTGKHQPIKSGYIEVRIKLIQVTGEDDKTITEMYFTSKGIHKLTGIFCQLGFDLQEAV